MDQEQEIQYFETLLTNIAGTNVNLVDMKSKKEYKPKKPSTRYDEVKGEYNHKPLNPNYFNECYKNSNPKIECPKCGRLTQKLKLFRHVQSMRCQKEAKLKIDLCALD